MTKTLLIVIGIACALVTAAFLISSSYHLIISPNARQFNQALPDNAGIRPPDSLHLYKADFHASIGDGQVRVWSPAKGYDNSNPLPHQRWHDARNGTGDVVVNPTYNIKAQGKACAAGHYDYDRKDGAGRTFYEITHTYFMYDTSALPADAVIISATLQIKQLGETYDIPGTACLFKGAQASGAELSANDFNAYIGNEIAARAQCRSGFLTFKINDLAAISKSGWTKFCLRETHDVDDIAPNLDDTYAFDLCYSELSPSTLSIEYTSASSSTSSGNRK